MRLPSSVQRLRLVGLGLGLQIVFAVSFALANPGPAAAQLQVCNTTKEDVVVAYGHLSIPRQGPTHLVIKGFYEVAAGACSIVDVSSVLFESTYLYAWELNNPKMAWSGNATDYQFCVPDNHKTNFEYHDDQARPPCGAGRLQESFFWIATGKMGFFREVLNDPTTPADQPKQPLAAPAPGAVPPSVAAPRPMGARAVLSTPSAPTGNAILSVTSGLTGQPNPLAGHTYVLMNQSYEAMLAGAGIQAPAGVSPVKGYLAACANHQPACQVGVSATNSSTVSGAKADPSGKAQLPGVPAGTYYFFCLGAYNNQMFKWDFQIQLKPGANSVTLDQHNATAVN